MARDSQRSSSSSSSSGGVALLLLLLLLLLLRAFVSLTLQHNDVLAARPADAFRLTGPGSVNTAATEE